MKKFLIGILTCLILTCCSNNYEDKTIYYKVEEFEIIKENIHTNVDGGYHHWYYGTSNMYKMCVTNKKDTIREEFVTTEKLRFIEGDSVYYNEYSCNWYLKNH